MTQTCNCCQRKLALCKFDQDKRLRHGRRYTCKKCARRCAAESRERLNRQSNGLYGILQGMKRRCYDPKHKSFDRYGARGIQICSQWLRDRETFYVWARAHGHRRGLHIDRIDNDGNYEPKNCRWVTPAVNQRNSTNAKLDSIKVRVIRAAIRKDTANRSELARRFGVSPSAISHAVRGTTWN